MGASAGARSPGTAATEAAKLQTAPSPSARRPPPARQINGRAQPAGPSPFPNASGGHCPDGSVGIGLGLGQCSRAAARPHQARSFLLPFLPSWILLGFLSKQET